MLTKWQRISLAIALISLCLGLSYYLLLRPENSTYALPWHVGELPLLPFMNSLPSFLHSLAFMLLGGLMVGQKMRYGLSWIAFWFVLELAFEVIQHSTVESILMGARVPKIIMLYAQGSFDIYDLLALGLAAFMAVLILFKGGEYAKDL